MTNELPSLPHTEEPPRGGRWRRLGFRLAKTAAASWKLLVGAAFCQNFLSSILVVGWTMRLSQGVVLKQWWKQSPLGDENVSFREFVALGAYHRGQQHWPNWILQQNRAWLSAPRKPGLRKIPAFFKSLFHSLWQNLKLGAQAIFNVWVFTMPACALMLFSWYAGWHNSFNKGYEQAVVGPLTGISGLLLFIAAMYYLPMAQMRQASTGEWRSFYQFRVVWELIRKRWVACLALALLYAALSLPVTVLKMLPAFFPQINPKVDDMAPPELLQMARNYFFFAAFFVFPAFVLLRMVAARIYAGAVVACVQSGALHEENLSENEWEALHRLDLLRIRPPARRHPVVQTITWFGTKLGRATIGIAIFLVWFVFISQVYVAEFVQRSEYSRGWLNQPLVQLPWFNYIPAALEEAAAPAPEPPLGPPSR